MAAPIAIQPTIQMNAGDCVICCLSMILGIPYVNVYKVAKDIYPECGIKGLTTRQTMRIVRKLGRTLESVSIKGLSLENETGILDVRIRREHHSVVLFEGIVYNPADGIIYNLDAYLAGAASSDQAKAVPTRLFRA